MGKLPEGDTWGERLSNLFREPEASPFAKYQDDPAGYAREVLKVELWPLQAEILEALLRPPYRVMVKSGHSIGKTFVSAVAVNWWYDCFDPSLAITTAPSERDVKDLLWKEIRQQRLRAGLPDDFIGRAAPEMRTAPDHYAKGYTARRGESFQGRHDKRMFFLFDEALGVDRSFWETTRTMFKPEAGHAWLVIFNPTDTSTVAYQQEHETDISGNPTWTVFTMSCLDHPNVVQKQDVIPGAVSYSQVAAWIVEWCQPIHASDRTATDFEWEGRWYRPGPEFESRAQGRWPSQGSFAVWSDALWEAASLPVDPTQSIQVDPTVLPEIGGDIAGPGKDRTEYHARWGPWSLRHESYTGWMLPRKMGRMIELCGEMAQLVTSARKAIDPNAAFCNPKQIRIKLDDANVGGEMVAMLRQQGYNAIGINSQQTWGVNTSKYPDMRSQLWFSTARQASEGLVRLGRLPRSIVAMLKAQAMAPTWELDHAGRRAVERKEVTMDKVGRSPDSLDAINLAYLNLDWKPPQWVDVPTAEPMQHQSSLIQAQRERTSLFGRLRGRTHRGPFGRR